MTMKALCTTRERGAGSGTLPESPDHGAPGPAACVASAGTAPRSLLPLLRPAPRSPLLALLGCLLGLSRVGIAQIPTNVPQPAQAQAALQQAIQQNPGLADVLRQRLQQSGLTPDQIRARLQASGYPANLLDAYLGGTTPGPSVAPGANELAAVQALGLAPITLPVAALPVDTGLVRAARGVAPVEAPSRVFGVDVFRRTTTQFLPLLSGPVPADYKLGPGDQLVLILTGDVELAYTLQVTREGFILIPQVGQLYVANLSLDHLRDVLYTRLGRVYSGVRRSANATTRFDISVANVRANQVYVVGEVAQPGAYQISSLGTVLTALYAAGGVTERAKLRAVEVRRVSKPLAALDLYDYLLRGDTRNDLRLETGDVVFVPVHGTRVEVTGAVRRAAVYELKPGENLSSLIVAAGGFRPEASLRRVVIERILPAAERGAEATARARIEVALGVRPGSRELGAVPSGGSVTASPVDPPRSLIVGSVLIPQMQLQDGDVVTVEALPDAPEAYFVSITGMIQNPGRYPWRPGITLRDLVRLARGPRVGALLKEAEIARLPTDRAEGQLATTVRAPMDSTYLFDRRSSGRYVGPPGLPAPAAGAPEVQLQPFDNVLILRQPEFELQRTVTVTGEVRYPGNYALKTKGDRLAELLQRAGRLTQRAYADGIRFARDVNGAGRINIDLAKALRDAGSRDNVILQPGDSLFIPEYIPSVKVVGAVNAPGSVLYRKGAGLGYYIDAAGGFAYTADQSRTSVRSAGGEVATRHKFLFFRSDPKPGPGSEVTVPLKDTSNPTNDVAFVGAIAQILGSTVAIIVVATKL